MAIEKPTQRSGVEVENAPPEVVSEWLHAAELTDLMNGRDPGVPPPIMQPVADPALDLPASDPDLGARGTQPETGQLDAADLRRMSAKQIHEARKAGRLDKLLGIQLR